MIEIAFAHPRGVRAIEPIEKSRKRGGRNARPFEAGLDAGGKVSPGDRAGRRDRRERAGEGEQNGEAPEALPRPRAYHVNLKPSWMNRWKFDCPWVFRLMRPKSADAVFWTYCTSSYIGLLK